jgi:hypothetical protein
MADAASVRAELLQGFCDRNPARGQHNRHGRDDLDALLDHRPAGAFPQGQAANCSSSNIDSHPSLETSVGNTASLRFGSKLREAVAWIERWTT